MEALLSGNLAWIVIAILVIQFVMIVELIKERHGFYRFVLTMLLGGMTFYAIYVTLRHMAS